MTKSKDWEYEKEKRIILGSDPVEFQLFPADAILKVTFGCRTGNEDLQEIVEIIKTKKLDWIQLSQMRMDKKSYRLIESYL